MPGRPRNSIPSLRHHKPTSRGVVTVNGRDVYLGRWPRGQAEAPPAVRAEYDRIIAEWLAAGRRSPEPAPAGPAPTAGLTVGGLILAYWPHVEAHYRRADGTPTNEADEIRLSLRPIRELYEGLPAADFSPLKIKSCRQRMIDGKEYLVRRLDVDGAKPRWESWRHVNRKDGKARLDAKRKEWARVEVLDERPELCRGVINKRIARIVRMFKWAVGEELVPVETFQALRSVAGLQRGRCEVRETAPVEPAPDAAVEAALPHLTPTLRALVRFQRLTGCRPSEACGLRPSDLDTSSAVWLYRPGHHKTQHRGKARAIAVGPKAQEVLRPFLAGAADDAHVFSPRRSMEQFRAAQRAARKTPVQPSQQRRQLRDAGRVAGHRPRVAHCPDAAAVDVVQVALPGAARRAGELQGLRLRPVRRVEPVAPQRVQFLRRCAEGYGAGGQLHTTRLLELSQDLPVRIEIIDLPERIDPLLPALGAMIGEGLVVVADVRIVRFLADPKK
jgi:integrase